MERFYAIQPEAPGTRINTLLRVYRTITSQTYFGITRKICQITYYVAAQL